MKTISQKLRFPQVAIRVVSYLLVLLPAALAFLYVREFGVNVPYWDDWWFVPLLEKQSAGTLTVSDLWHQNNAHRQFFPRIVWLLLAIVTEFSYVAEMYLSLVFLLITLIVLLFAFKSSTTTSLFLFLPISFLMFSLRQYANMLWGFQMTYAMVIAFSVLTLFFLHNIKRKGLEELAFLAALVSATVASFSSLNGLFVWPIGLLQLLLSPVEKPATKKLLIGIWSLFGLGEWILYFVGFERLLDDPLTTAFEYPKVATEFFLTLLGSTLFWQQNFAFVAGLLLSGLAVASLLLAYKDGKVREHFFWIALLSFSFLTMAAIVLERFDEDASRALEPRFASFSILAVIAIYALLMKLVVENSSRSATVLVSVLFGLLLLSVPISYSEGIMAGETTKASREQAALSLSTYESQPDELLLEDHCPTWGCWVYPYGRQDANTLREMASILERLGYSVFSEPQARALRPSSLGLFVLPHPTGYSSNTVEPAA